VAKKNLTALLETLSPALELEHGDKTYVVPPPTKEDGLKMTAVYAYSVQIATKGPGEALDNLTEKQRAIIEALGDEVDDLAPLALGDAYQEMVDDGIPGPHIDIYGQYALYYWVLGETTADKAMDAVAENKVGGGKGPKAPQDRRPSKSGRSTGSANRKTG